MALLSLAGLKLPIQQLTGHAMVVHPDNVSHPSQLGLDKYGFRAGTLCTVQDLKVCDTVLSSNAKYGAEGRHACESSPAVKHACGTESKSCIHAGERSRLQLCKLSAS